MPLPQVVTPPAAAPKVETPSASTTETTTTQTPPVQVTPPANTETPKKRSGRHEGDNFSTRVAKRAEELRNKELLEKAGVKPTETPAVETKAAETPVETKAAETTTTATPTTPDDSDDAIKAEIEVKTKGMDGASKQAWADLRYRERELRRQLKDVVTKEDATKLQTEVATLKQQLEAAKQSPATDPEEVKALKARLSEFENDMAVAKVEKTDAFKKSVTQILEVVDQAAEKLAKKYDITADDMRSALYDSSDSQSDKLEAIFEKMNTLDKSKLMALLPKIEEANNAATTLRAKASEALARIEQQNQGKTAAQVEAANQARSTSVDKVWETLKADPQLKDLLAPMEGTEADVVAWNQQLTEAPAFARTFDGGSLTPDEQAEAGLRVSIYPILLGAVASMKSQMAEMETKHNETLKRLSKYENTQPSGESTREGGTPTDPYKGMGWAERITARIREGQAKGTLK